MKYLFMYEIYLHQNIYLFIFVGMVIFTLQWNNQKNFTRQLAHNGQYRDSTLDSRTPAIQS